MGLALGIGRITNDDYELIYSYLLELRVGKGNGVYQDGQAGRFNQVTTGKHVWGISWFAAGRWSPGFRGRRHEPNTFIPCLSIPL